MVSVLTQVGIIVLSLVGLIVCSEIAVRKILILLKHYKLSATFGGLTIFSVTTSLPEIFSHLVASLGIVSGRMNYKIASATVLGANIGSDVVQQTLILGLVVLLMGGLTFKRDFLFSAYAPMIATTLMTWFVAIDGVIDRIDGAILLITFGFYMYYLYNKKSSHTTEKAKRQDDIWKIWGTAIVCLLVMLVAAHFLLTSAEFLVKITGLGGSLIGVISLGIASAAPEFFTALMGLRNKSAGLSLGTLIGSNITNPLVAIGGGALISTYWVPRGLVFWDLPMETITAALLFVYLLKNKGKLGKTGAWYLIGLYVVYLAVRFALFSVD